jgi:hypothetical protein
MLGLGLGLGLRVGLNDSGGRPLSEEVLAYKDRVESFGGTVNNNALAALNTFWYTIRDFSSAFAFLWVPVSTGTTGLRSVLIGSNFNIQDITDSLWDFRSGLTGDASLNINTTYLLPNVNANSNSMGVYLVNDLNNSSDALRHFIGRRSNTGSPGTWIGVNASSSWIHRNVSGAASTPLTDTPTDSGIVLVNRNNSSNYDFWVNTTKIVITSTSQSPIPISSFLYGYNNQGTLVGNGSGITLSMAWETTRHLSDTEIEIFRNAANTLQLARSSF